MNKIILLILAFLLVSCGGEKETVTTKQADIDYDILLKGGDKKISFLNEARPVLEKRCIVCHGCYDAPCQLKLTSIEGIKRGANPDKVYDSERIFAVKPTRLFIDAKNEKEWREKGFHSVLNEQQESADNNLRHSVLYKMLRLKQLNPQPRIGMIDDEIDLSLGREQACPTNKEFEEYAEDFPSQGMPFATPNMSDEEYHILVKWISQGMPDDRQKTLPAETTKQIKKWETFLNQSDLKHQLISRYLYEHLFIGHLYFKGGDTREFFRLVRSYTPPGKPISEIPTTRVYSDPKVDKFYYRLRYIKSSIVNKSHVIYGLSDKRMARYKELFVKPKYEVKKLPSYIAAQASNPFKTFADLPVKSRYKFLLDDAKFFIEGFIKGPVCRGQVALNVIEDQFWVFFGAPDAMKVNYDNEFINEIADNFQLPTEKENTLNLLSTWTNYWDLQLNYMVKRQKVYMDLPQMELDNALSFIWDGSGSMDKNNSALTIFRHFDSATVKQGMLGNYPESAWILDYPILERIHYLLVAGYDVYGNIGHQFNTRVYMDFLRMEAENSFLAFLPPESREDVRERWYKGIRQNLKKYFKSPDHWLKVQVVNGFKTDDPQREFYKKLEQKFNQYPVDYINRCEKPSCDFTKNGSSMDKQIQQIAKIKGKQLIVFPDTALLKVIGNKQDQAYTLINNKEYKNISSLLSSTDNRDREGDTMSVYKGILGAYPNFFFVVKENDLENFVDIITAIKDRDDYEKFVSIYGVRRTAARFWKEADWFSAQFAKQEPRAYGIFDLYRYSNR
ncbi:Fatty acid cis/trans isomerase [hydrothermal vent metagenome]|uniref:Fatty acid cis/trans isomerase n=1 Tax=hydrothermal vent metagenome TaxID=652676 RepID=A0A3B0YBC7_9ZZZZ